MMAISPGERLDHAQLGHEPRAALLRHDQHFAVGIVEIAVGHRAVGGVDVHRHADLRRDVAIAAERDDAFDEVGRLLRDRERAPAQLRRRRFDLVERRASNEPVVDARIRPVHGRRLDAVGPGAAVFGTRGRERGAGNQLGVEAIGRPLRTVAADRQRARHCLGHEMVAEAGLVLQRRFHASGLGVGLSDLGIHGQLRRNWSRSKLIFRLPRSRSKYIEIILMRWPG